MIQAQVFNQIAKELNIPVKEVARAYNSYWQFIKETIRALPLEEDLTKEEFDKLRTNFNLPSLGNFYCTYEGMMYKKQKNKELREKKYAKSEENQTDVYRIGDNDGQV